MIIVDTNVLSEMLKENPSSAVVDWYKSVAPAHCFATAITQAEMLAGAIVLPAGKRRAQLVNSIINLFEVDFSDRLLAFDGPAAIRYAEIVARRRKIGAPIEPLDAQIAAIAKDKGMVIATRNIRDFQDCGVDLVDPWTS